MVEVKNKDITKFLDAWDKKAFSLNVELKKILLKQKKEQVILRKNESFALREHK